MFDRQTQERLVKKCTKASIAALPFPKAALILVCVNGFKLGPTGQPFPLCAPAVKPFSCS